MKIYLNNEQDIKLPEEIENDIKKSIKLCLNEEKNSDKYEISITFVDNNSIKHLNSEFRNKNIETDVLSFPLIDENFLMPEIEEDQMLGDIVISIEKAKEQADRLDHSLRREIIYLVIHSMYHLMGYDHMNENEKKEMREKEKNIIRKLKIFREEN